jgi:two-component system KDP operon response regulator KdpE
MNATNIGYCEASAAATPAPGRQAAAPQALSELNRQRAGLASKKILIVDDNAVIVRTTSLKLRSCGYAVITALDGAAAIQAAREQKPDLILLDLDFPPDVAHGGNVVWDGLRIMEWLRRLDTDRSIPVIVITGGDPARYKAACMAAGALAFVGKPIDHDSLAATIKLVLEEPAELLVPGKGAVLDVGL